MRIAFKNRCRCFIFMWFRFRLIRRFRIAINILRYFPSKNRPFVRATFSFCTFMAPINYRAAFHCLIRTFNTCLCFRPFTFEPRCDNVRKFMSIAFKCKRPITRAFKVKRVRVNRGKVCLPTFLFFLISKEIRGSSSNGRIVRSFRKAFLFLRFLVSKVSKLNAPFRIRLRSYFFRLVLCQFSGNNCMFIAKNFHFIRFILCVVVCIIFDVFRKGIFRLQFRFM